MSEEKSMSERAKELAEQFETQPKPLGDEFKELKPIMESPTKAELSFSQQQVEQIKNDENKTTDQKAMDIANLVGVQDALNDEQTRSTISDIKKEQIASNVKVSKEIDVAKKEAEKIKALTESDIAYYEQNKGILEWGGIKEPTTKKMTKFLLCLIVPFYTLAKIFITMPISIIKTLFKAINELLEEISKFGKWARRIAVSILIIGIVALIIYILLFFLDKYEIINIF